MVVTATLRPPWAFYFAFFQVLLGQLFNKALEAEGGCKRMHAVSMSPLQLNSPVRGRKLHINAVHGPEKERGAKRAEQKPAAPSSLWVESSA